MPATPPLPVAWASVFTADKVGLSQGLAVISSGNSALAALRSWVIPTQDECELKPSPTPTILAAALFLLEIWPADRPKTLMPGSVTAVWMAMLCAEAAICTQPYPSTCWMVQRLTSRRLASCR